MIWSQLIIGSREKKCLSQDIVKLHAEINQYINQILTITTHAITLFGVVIGWVVLGYSATKNGADIIHTQPMSLIIPTGLLIILVGMLKYCEAIIKQQHILSSYLVLTKSSYWEEDYQEFARIRKFSIQNNLPLYIFITLITFSVLIPLISFFMFPPESLNCKMVITISTCLFFIIISIIIVVKCWEERYHEDFRKKVTEHWKSILSNN